MSVSRSILRCFSMVRELTHNLTPLKRYCVSYNISSVFLVQKKNLSKCSSRCFKWMPNPWFPYFPIFGFHRRLNKIDLKWSDLELRRGVACQFLARQGPKMAYLQISFRKLSTKYTAWGFFAQNGLQSQAILWVLATLYLLRSSTCTVTGMFFLALLPSSVPGKQGAISDMFFTFFFHAGSWTNFEINFGWFLSHYYGLQPSFGVFRIWYKSILETIIVLQIWIFHSGRVCDVFLKWIPAFW